ncbi:hypothetical protein INT48_007053 [Thamnidium elegans]|uniref:Uncharacterized protein n=1 Tax=Thamnidium elegans TaxID=101142 RepID=A0A8H7SI68_9FUNG|nr:hypothetical protein INT48_007053 [Thamnidium elegans]
MIRGLTYLDRRLARIPQPFFNVEVQRSGDSNQCNETDLDSVQQPVYLPALEHDTQYTSEAAIGSGKGMYADNTTLDQCNMVPSPVTTNSTQSVSDPTGSSPSSSRTIAFAFGEESTLAVDGMAPGSLGITKQRRIDLPSTLNEESSAIIYDPTWRKLQHQRYDGTQQRFLNRGTQHNRNVLEFVTDIDLVNYLAYGHFHHKWVYSTILQYKQSILQLYTTEQRAQITSDSLYIKFFATLKNRFLRPSDIERINDGKALVSANTLRLVILDPKEKRSGRPIEKVVVISVRSNPSLCPVALLSSFSYVPLVRNVTDSDKCIGSERISNHIKFVLNLATTTASPASLRTKTIKARVVGSTRAILAGAKL